MKLLNPLKNMALLLIFLLPLPLASLAQAEVPEETSPVGPWVLSVPRSVSSLPFLALEDQQILGRPVEVRIFDDHALAFASFLTGESDWLLTGFNQGLNHHLGGGDILQVTVPIWGVSSLLSRNSSLNQVQDLAGKTLMVPFAGSPLDLQLRAILAHHGLLDTVTIEYAPIQQQIPLLVQGRVDAISVPEPLVSRLTTQQGAHEVFWFPAAWEVVTGDSRSPQVALFARPGSQGSREEALEVLLSRVDQSLESLELRWNDWSQQFAEALGQSPEILGLARQRTLFDRPSPEDVERLSRSYLPLLGENREPEARYFWTPEPRR